MVSPVEFKAASYQNVCVKMINGFSNGYTQPAGPRTSPLSTTGLCELLPSFPADSQAGNVPGASEGFLVDVDSSVVVASAVALCHPSIARYVVVRTYWPRHVAASWRT